MSILYIKGIDGTDAVLHIFRSTVLDSWSWEQLRMMKVGGNQNASEYFSKHGGNGAKDTRAKYSGRTGEQYKELLVKRAAEDAIT